MNLEQTTELSVSEHAQKLGHLALSLGYDGSLTVGALEDEIRFYQRRTVEACLELGKRLILLKEITPHGEFKQRIEMLNINERTAQRFISTALKFNKSDNLSVLKAAGNQSKLLELLVLDDEDIDELSNGGSVNDITLDDIDRMTASELRKKLREYKADLDTKDQVIKTKDQKANELLAENAKLKSPAQIKERAESEQQQFEQAAIAKLNAAKDAFLPAFTKFTNDIGGVIDTADAKDLPQLYENIDELLIYACQRIAGYVQSLGTQVNFEEIVKPSWITDEPTDPVEE